MDTTVMLGHGSGGTMMKRIIDEVFFAAYAGDELLRGSGGGRDKPDQGRFAASHPALAICSPVRGGGGDEGDNEAG